MNLTGNNKYKPRISDDRKVSSPNKDSNEKKGILKGVKTVKGRIGLNLVSNSELVRP